MHQLSRREFVALAAAAPFARPAATPAALTGQDVVDRIKARLGVAWKPETVDAFKAGDPAAEVKGVVTTALATMEVLKLAVQAGASLIVTCEPTFYSRADVPTPPRGRGAEPAAPDAVFSAKDAFIRKHQLAVFRLSDHWRLRTPNPFALGLVDALGWAKFRSGDDPSRVSVPELSLEALAASTKKALAARGGIRVVGAPATRVRTIGVLPGSTPIQAALAALPAVDAIVAGEVREWEGVEYVRDTVATGGKKGLILVGRVQSEQPGMRECAKWLGEIVPEVRTTWIGGVDPYWRPL
jgi:putative NIF3 family GTP cyclohydrolase 1 type 2